VGLETKMFRVLKSIGVELTRYHGGSLMGKDIKKVMDNASYIFDEFKKILKDGSDPMQLLTMMILIRSVKSINPCFCCGMVPFLMQLSKLIRM